MYKCPINPGTCAKICDNPMDLAKHINYPSGDETKDKEHESWIIKNGINKMDLDSLTKLLKQTAKYNPTSLTNTQR